MLKNHASVSAYMLSITYMVRAGGNYIKYLSIMSEVLFFPF